LAARVAIVTGGANGIGRGVALELAARGADIVIADLDEAASRKVSNEVIGAGRKALLVRADVSQQASTDALAATAIREFGKVDILVNNAGVWGAPGWPDRDEIATEDWDGAFAVNVFGIVHTTRSVEKHMLERRQGKIVNIVSVAGRAGMGGSAHYSASKAAAINVTQAYALRLAKSGINVNAIAPGALWTDLSDRAMARRGRTRPELRGLSPRAIFERLVAERVPLSREQTPEDVGKACAFLVSDRARSITGQTLNVTGGWMMN
jgi:NAD(P)-dependent dehydrogenase (short-subunit alcohol dehydrogenase family)